MIRTATFLAAALALGLAGCSGAPLADVRHRAPRIALMPLVNLSGRDLTALPGMLWESAGTQRILTRVQRSETRLEQLPFPPEVLEQARLQPGSAAKQLEFDATLGVLAFNEPMLPSDRDQLRAMSGDAQWQAAIDALWDDSRQSVVDVLAPMRSALVAKLSRAQFDPVDFGDEFVAGSAPLPKTTGRDDFLQRARDAAATARAQGVLTVAIEQWDWTGVFETREIRISLAAVLTDPANGEPIWRRETGAVVCRVPDALVRGGVIDMRDAWPRYVPQLLDLLFD